MVKSKISCEGEKNRKILVLNLKTFKPLKDSINVLVNYKTVWLTDMLFQTMNNLCINGISRIILSNSISIQASVCTIRCEIISSVIRNEYSFFAIKNLFDMQIYCLDREVEAWKSV